MLSGPNSNHHWKPQFTEPRIFFFIKSAPAEGQQQQQQQTTSDVTSKFPWCYCASVAWSGKEALDVASDAPPDEALSCRRRA